MKLIYHEPLPISRDEFTRAIASEDESRIRMALVSLAFHDPELSWPQERFLELLKHNNRGIAQTAAICLGHLARIHGQIDRRVVRALKDLKTDPDIGGYAEGALEDIAIFVHHKKTAN